MGDLSGVVENPELTAPGRQQSVDLVGRLVGIDISTIYVDSIRRTSLTIEPTVEDQRRMPTVVPEIREWAFGDEPIIDDFIERGGKLYADMFTAWVSGDMAARPEGRPTSQSVHGLRALIVPGYEAIVERHRDEDGTVVIVGHGGSIGRVMPSFADKDSLEFGVFGGVSNTGIVDVEFRVDGTPFVTPSDGIAFDPDEPVGAAVPLPARARQAGTRPAST